MTISEKMNSEIKFDFLFWNEQLDVFAWTDQGQINEIEMARIWNQSRWRIHILKFLVVDFHNYVIFITFQSEGLFITFNPEFG